MDAHRSDISRRRALSRGAHWVAGTAFLAMAAVPSHVRAKAAKADFNYQDKSKNGKSCATCRLFAPTESGRGTCAVVEGDVSPAGWCMAYSERS